MTISGSNIICVLLYNELHTIFYPINVVEDYVVFILVR